jgi:hypothetical protein
MTLNYHLIGAGAAMLGFVVVCYLFVLACGWIMDIENKAFLRWLDENERKLKEEEGKYK